jgi:t-SNARE complex subunit (syntaxin)
MNTITPLNNVRDKIVDSVETKYNRQTDVMTVNKQVEDVVTYFKRMFNIDKDTAKKANNQSGHLNETIRESQIQLEQINNISPFILGIIIILIVVIFVYLFGSMFLGNYVHGVALGIIGIGMAFLLNFSGTIK